jgi:hypothetical protein
MSHGKKPLANANIFDALFSAGDSLFFWGGALLATYSQNAVIKKLQVLKIKGFERFSIAIIRIF